MFCLADCSISDVKEMCETCHPLEEDNIWRFSGWKEPSVVTSQAFILAGPVYGKEERVKLSFLRRYKAEAKVKEAAGHLVSQR